MGFIKTHCGVERHSWLFVVESWPPQRAKAALSAMWGFEHPAKKAGRDNRTDWNERTEQTQHAMSRLSIPLNNFTVILARNLVHMTFSVMV
jgi:hypothetical protein